MDTEKLQPLKITEGKWYVSDIEQEDGEYIYTKHNMFTAIARVYKGDNPHSENAKANAKLMAEAPDLLATLIRVKAFFENENIVGSINIAVTEAIEKAIN